MVTATPPLPTRLAAVLLGASARLMNALLVYSQLRRRMKSWRHMFFGLDGAVMVAAHEGISHSLAIEQLAAAPVDAVSHIWTGPAGLWAVLSACKLPVHKRKGTR